jgi:Nucleotidyl transferase of unknown function (DUF2204)
LIRGEVCHNHRSSSHIQAEVPSEKLNVVKPPVKPPVKPNDSPEQKGCHAETELPVSSSTPPEFPAEQVQLFRAVLQSLNARQVRYLVSGAFALRQHTGICRDTKDLDLFLPAADVSAALRELNGDGLETEITDPTWLAKAHRDGFFVDLISGMSNGVVTVDQSWIDRGSPADVLGVPVQVLAAEELFASKLFVTRRERFDGADLCHIIYGAKGKLDWARIMALVGEAHWELVLWAILLYDYVYPGNSAYIPRNFWDDLLGRLRQTIDRPSPAPFRGSLIDPKMFAIDVDEWGMGDLSEEYLAKRQKIS